jgi:hypothetical protein
VWIHMQQILKRAGGGQPFLEQGQSVILLIDAENDGFTVGARIQNSNTVKVEDFACTAVAS